MLVYSRKERESIVLDVRGLGPATVTVTEIRGDKVRLGIVVPREWFVHRQEVWDAIHRPEGGGVASSAAPPPQAQTPHSSSDDLAHYAEISKQLNHYAAISKHLDECEACRLAFLQYQKCAPPAAP